MDEAKICIFKLSREEEFPNGIEEVIIWIAEKSKGEAKYHFREKKPRELSIGSIVLFSIEGKIVGEGIVSQSIRPTPSDMRRQLKEASGYDYPYYTMFKPSSLITYKRFPTTSKVMEKTNLTFGRVFTYVRKWEQYHSILELANSSSIKKKKTQDLLALEAAFEEPQFDAIEEAIQPDVESLSAEKVKELIATRDTRNKGKGDFKRNQTRRIYSRDPVLSALLKRMYADTCQINTCQANFRLDHGFFTETHHIIPRHKKGEDTSSNILVLCPNHHKLFDKSTVRIIERTRTLVTLDVSGEEIQADVRLS